MSAPIWHWGEPVAPLRDLLARGGVLAIPTESSYGLGVDPWNRTGVETIYRIKEREAGKALPVVIAGREQLAGLGIDPDLHIVEALFAFWPAPLTAVLPVARPLPASAGGRNLAVRVPDHDRLRELLAAIGHGLTATSANRSGEPPILEPAGVAGAARRRGRDGGGRRRAPGRAPLDAGGNRKGWARGSTNRKISLRAPHSRARSIHGRRTSMKHPAFGVSAGAAFLLAAAALLAAPAASRAADPAASGGQRRRRGLGRPGERAAHDPARRGPARTARLRPVGLLRHRARALRRRGDRHHAQRQPGRQLHPRPPDRQGAGEERRRRGA